MSNLSNFTLRILIVAIVTFFAFKAYLMGKKHSQCSSGFIFSLEHRL